MSGLGTPRRHYRRIDSTNARLRALAERGTPPHGTLVSASEQTDGRGRQGRTWTAPGGRALLVSMLIREPQRLLSLAAGVAVAESCGPEAQIKWPNDVLIDGRKVAGILVEGRPQENWAVLGIGLNVALGPDDFPPELRSTAATLGRDPDQLEPTLSGLIEHLEHWIPAAEPEVLRAVRQRDALNGRPVSWTGGAGTAAGIDPDGRLIVHTDSGTAALDSGEVHLRI